MTRGRAPAPDASRLRPKLLAWFLRNRRRLPWREDRDPYRVWVSEVMLQQTTVKVVVPHYQRFLSRFPSLPALAAATEDAVLTAWSGLGYYHRARNLHRGARHVLERHAGVFPGSLEAALAVPGVGLYTASAVLSIAYGLPLPVVDGNVRRVLARLFALRGAKWRREGAYYNKAEELLDRRSPGDWNEAVMELGATLCTPRSPGCPACPLRGDCAAQALGVACELPESQKRRTPVRVTLAAALIERSGRVLLVRRPEGRLLGRLWELPQTSLDGRGRPDLVASLRESHGLDVDCGPLLVAASHAVTFRRIRLEGYRARLLGAHALEPRRFRWVTPEEVEGLPVSSMTRKLLRGLKQPQLALPLGE